MSQLRYELSTDKPFRLLKDNGEDVNIWNNHLESLKLNIGETNCSWFKAPWLFAECYMYRRIREVMLMCKTDMKNYDPFENAKIEGIISKFPIISSLFRQTYLNLKQNKSM